MSSSDCWRKLIGICVCSEGLESVAELQEAYKEKIQEYRRSASTVVTPEPSKPATSTTQTSPFPAPPPPPKTAQTSSATTSQPGSKSAVPGIKPLSSYLDLDKIRCLPVKEIEVLWRLRHAKNSNSLCAVVPLDIYKRIYQSARQNPQFILPLPREIDAPADVAPAEKTPDGKTAGAEIHFLQWAFHPPAESAPTGTTTENTHTSTVLFTHLAQFKVHGSYAQPHTVVTHHLDLADSHGIVLLIGNIVPDRGVSIDDGRWLLMNVQRFYDFDGEGKGRKGELVRMFTKGDTNGFTVQELMDEAERLS